MMASQNPAEELHKVCNVQCKCLVTGSLVLIPLSVGNR